MTPLLPDQIIQALGQLLPEQVRSFEQWTPQLQQTFTQLLPPEPTPDLPNLIAPTTPQEMGEVLRWASQNQHRLLICGAGSKLHWGGLPTAIDAVVSTQCLNKIIAHAVGDLTLQAEAGTTLAQVQTVLAKTGQMVALDPAYPETATLGGILATRDAGSWRHRYGGVRDQCLGLSFVRADGQRAKAGGQVVKNVAGYDLMKLFTGSYGSLGVVTDLTLRLYPIPEASQTLFLQGESLPLGRLLSFLRDSTLTPTVLDGMGGELVTQLGGTAPVGLVIRFQSLAESVIAQVQQTREWAADLVVKVLSGEEETQFWRQLRRSLWSSAPTNITVVAKVGGLPNQTVAQLEKAAAIAQAAHLTFSGLIHSGSGVGTIRVSGAELDHLRNGVLALRQHWQQAQGYLSILEAPYGLKQIVEVWGYGGNAMVSDRPVAIAPMQQLKDKFDPYHCLNPGRFVGGM